MIVLGLESSAKSASVALSHDNCLLNMDFQNTGLTHSCTLLPMVENILKRCGLQFQDLDVIAVSQGPGSFTGIRIGISTVKGLCWATGKPAIGVSTLESIAWNANYTFDDNIVCCSMDARRNQVYNALFMIQEGRPYRLTKDRAIDLANLSEELKKYEKPILVLGDGSELCYNYLSKEKLAVTLAPEQSRFQNAWGVCRAASNYSPSSAANLLPVYLRLSQAERERLERLNKETSKK